MAVDKEIKRRITQEWLKAFPGLQPYAQNKLYKNIGPFVMGIELINLPRSENYRPHFVIYPLYRNNIKSCLDYPCLMREFFNSKKLQINLPYNDTRELFKDAQKIVAQSLKFEFKEDVSLLDLYSLVDDRLINDPIFQRHSGHRASLLEVKFYAAVYTRSQTEMEKIINQVKDEQKNWDMKMFESWHGQFDLWIKGLERNAINTEEFFKKIVINKQDKKIDKLLSSDLKM